MLADDGVRSSAPGSGEVVGEIPGPQLTRLETNEQVVASTLGVLLTCFGPEVARGYPADDRPVFRHAEARVRANLDAAVRRAIVADNDARPRISTEVLRFHVTRPGHDVEAVVPPFMPDRREENRA